MKYFIDTEFHEYHKQVKCCGIKIDKPIPTIDLISIGIISEDGREYYAVSKDFNLRDAWFSKQENKDKDKQYWLRNNVLMPILHELTLKAISNPKVDYISISNYSDYKQLQALLHVFGKTNKQIAEEVIEFCNPTKENEINVDDIVKGNIKNNKEFYAYYADYDWVVFCQLFGKMIDLPNGFPMYCIDLKQELDNYISKTWKDVKMSTWGHEGISLDKFKQHPNYPKQTNKHNALADAKWNYELYKFLDTL